jgi:transposase
MSRRLPKYRLHKPSGQAVVTLGGRDHYLGKWQTPASQAEYDRLITQWLAGGRRLRAAPREFRSGTSVRKRTRLSKAGSARLRKALYLPTLTAVRFNPLLEGFYERLVRSGKPKMQAVGACMRKLVMLCYGVLKNRAPFDPAWASKKAS